MRQHIIDSTLAAAPQSPGSEPATVPGKWIPVSERMPEVGDIVLTAMGGAVNVGEMECSAANCLFFTSVISGRELPATHWMPLPAGPKEDINALIPLVSRNEQEGK
ncbi:Eaa1 [Klebsiella variicola]|nr:Eaa1 [Klebsiella variicola]